MLASGLMAALAVATTHGALAADSALLAEALGGRTLDLTMRGTTVAVLASAVPAEDGCAALATAHAPGSPRKWTRRFRWSEVAWTGTTAEGRTTVSFFEHEGRLPGDTLEFAPADAAGFRAALARVVGACRAARGAGERIAIAGSSSMPTCYFARLPALELIESAAPPPMGDPPRAVLTLLSRENPQAELQLLVERAAPDSAAGSDDWGRPAVAFTFADPRLKDMRIGEARFALDGKAIKAQHTIAAYGDTRIRISMDSLPVAGSKAPPSFYRSLAGSGEVGLTLLDEAGKSQAVLHFDAGPALAAAREALRAADWSCASAAPAPAPAARWQPATS